MASPTYSYGDVTNNDTSLHTLRWPLAYSIHRATGLPKFDDEVFNFRSDLAAYLGRAYDSQLSIISSGSANLLCYEGQTFFVRSDNTSEYNGKYFIKWENNLNAWVLIRLAATDEIPSKADPWTSNNILGTVIPTNLNGATITFDESSGYYENALEIMYFSESEHALPVDMDNKGHIYVPINNNLYDILIGGGTVKMADPWTYTNPILGALGTVIPINYNSGTLTLEKGNATYADPLSVLFVENKKYALPVDMDSHGYIYVPLNETLYGNMFSGTGIASPWSANDTLGTTIPIRYNIKPLKDSNEQPTGYTATLSLILEAEKDMKYALPVDMDPDGHIYVPLTETQATNLNNGGGSAEKASPWTDNDKLGTVIPINSNIGTVTKDKENKQHNDNIIIMGVDGAEYALPVDMDYSTGHIYVPFSNQMWAILTGGGGGSSYLGVPLMQFIKFESGGQLQLCDSHGVQDTILMCSGEYDLEIDTLNLHNTFYYLDFEERTQAPNLDGYYSSNFQTAKNFRIDYMSGLDNSVLLLRCKWADPDPVSGGVALEIFNDNGLSNIALPNTSNTIVNDTIYWIEFKHGFVWINEIHNQDDDFFENYITDYHNSYQIVCSEYNTYQSYGATVVQHSSTNIHP